MQNIKETLKNAATSKAFPKWTSNFCYNHIPSHVMPIEPTANELAALQEKFRVQMMERPNGEGEVCPRCACDQETKKLEQEISTAHNKVVLSQKMNTFHEKSVFQDETLKQAKFESYVLDDEQHEARVNLQEILRSVEAYKEGRQFNLWLTGNVGVGKSHLSVSLLKALRSLNTSCLFIDIDEMLRRIRHAMYVDKESPYTEYYFVDLATKVDFLVLDDLGAETGNINTQKDASDFTSRVLRAIVNGRQDKSTIFTTNLSYRQLIQMYDAKLVDRMLKNNRMIKFTETQSYRSRGIDF